MSQDLTRTTFTTWPLSVSWEAKAKGLLDPSICVNSDPVCDFFSCLDMPFSSGYNHQKKKRAPGYIGKDQKNHYNTCHHVWGTFHPVPTLHNRQVLGLKLKPDLELGKRLMSVLLSWPPALLILLLSLIMYGRHNLAACPSVFLLITLGSIKHLNQFRVQAPLAVLQFC